MCYQVAMPFVQYEGFQNPVVSLHPITVLSLPRKLLSWCLPLISPLALLCSAPVLQDLALCWGYRFICCAGWEEHLFSLVMDSSTFLEGFCFFLSQVLTVPMLGNIPSLALVFRSSTSGVYSDSWDISGITRSWLRGLSAGWRTQTKTLCCTYPW